MLLAAMSQTAADRGHATALTVSPMMTALTVSPMTNYELAADWDR